MEIDSEKLIDLNLKIQEFLFQKSSQDEVTNYLITHNFSIETLLANLFYYQEHENNLDMVITIIDKLLRWECFKSEFVTLLLNSNADEILSLKASLVKKYLIDFIKKNSEKFAEQEFLHKLLKVYITDTNSGVYENTLNLISHLLSEYKEATTENKLIQNILTYLEMIVGDDSIILIRELELISTILKIYQNEENCLIVLKRICNNLFQYDILTTLTILDTLELKVANENIVNFILKEINFFQTLSSGENFDNALMRKMMYTLSKFYANKILNENTSIKNFLGVSLQYHEDNKEDSQFIISVLLNTFHNKDIFYFLMDPNNNIQIDFQNCVIDIIVENYYNFDPKIKQQVLEIFSIICNFSIPSTLQEQFMKKMFSKFYFYEFNKYPNDENLMFAFVVEKLYKDFKTHDFEDYEFTFLDTILSLLTSENIVKKIFSNFDLILYLLNRRPRPQNILLIKFEIIKTFQKSNYMLSGGVEKSLSEQIDNYIKKGPY